MNIRERYYLLIPRASGGFQCVGNAAQAADLRDQAEYVAGVYDSALICKPVESFGNECIDEHASPPPDNASTQEHMPSSLSNGPRPPGEKPLALPVASKDKRMSKRTTEKPASRKGK